MPVIRNISANLDIEQLENLAAVTGTGPTNTRLRGLLPEILMQVNRNEPIIPCICYEIVAVDKSARGTITLENGDILESPLLAHRIAGASHILFGVATIGSAMAETVRRCFKQGNSLKAILMEQLANAALFQTTNRLQSMAEQRASDIGLTASGPLSPGDHEGFGLDQQATVLKLAGATKIDITMTRTGQMNPVHSISVVIGLGTNMRKWTRVDDCRICRSRDRCCHYPEPLETSA
jgi:hypothetical protein